MLIGWTHGIINENNKGFPLVGDVMSVFEHVRSFQLSNNQGNGTLQLLKDFVLRHPTRDEVVLHRDMRCNFINSTNYNIYYTKKEEISCCRITNL